MNTELKNNKAFNSLCELYLDMQEEKSKFLLIAGNKSDKSILKNEKKLYQHLQKIKELSEESNKTALLLPPLYKNDDFMLLYNCKAKMKGSELEYELLPVIYHNNGAELPTRAIDLFSHELSLDYDESKSWKENMKKVLEDNEEDKRVLQAFNPSSPIPLKVADFMVQTCKEIYSLDEDYVKQNWIKTEHIVKEAENLRLERIKQKASPITMKSVHEQILSKMPPIQLYERER